MPKKSALRATFRGNHLLHPIPCASGVVLDGPLFRHLGFELALELRQYILAALELRFGLLQLFLGVLELDLCYSKCLELRLHDLPMYVRQRRGSNNVALRFEASSSLPQIHLVLE